MFFALLKIRKKQFIRKISYLGVFRILFLLLLLISGCSFLFLYVSDSTNAWYVSLFYTMLVVLLHKNRTDKDFLKIHFYKYKLVYFAEYFLLLLPLLFCFIYYLHFSQLFASGLIVCLLINFNRNKKKKTLNALLIRAIPSSCYEWKAGFRQLYFYLIALILAGILTSFSKLVFVFILLLGIIPLHFLEKGEPYQMILAYEKGVSAFLNYKIKMQALLCTMLLIPLFIGVILFHLNLWHIAIVEYVAILSMNTYAILVKYAYYVPTYKTPSVFLAFSIAALIPFLLPLVWCLSVYFYLKSTKNLKKYLNDYTT